MPNNTDATCQEHICLGKEQGRSCPTAMSSYPTAMRLFPCLRGFCIPLYLHLFPFFHIYFHSFFFICYTPIPDTPQEKERKERIGRKKERKEKKKGKKEKKKKEEGIAGPVLLSPLLPFSERGEKMAAAMSFSPFSTPPFSDRGEKN